MKLNEIFKPTEEQKGIKLKTIFVNSAILAGLISLMLFCGAFMGIENTTNSNQLPQGVKINDENVGGLDIEQVKLSLLEKEKEKLDSINFNLMYNDKEYKLDKTSMGLTSNLETVIDDVYSQNKGENLSIEEIFEKSVDLKNGANFTSILDIDEQLLYNNLKGFIDENSTIGVDASAEFNKETQEFEYKNGKNGTSYDPNNVIKKISEKLNNGDFTDLQIFGEVINPKNTISDVKKNTQLVASYETEANNDANRNTNIQLVTDAINGLKIESGQTLSINELLGERTKEKGYKEAPAIVNQTQIENEVGGGICQVSGTLYNAALLANMEIAQRVHHSFPSDYLPIGLDATLNWDDKDLKLKNASLYPVYIGAEFKDEILKVSIYGEPLEANEKIEIINDITNTQDPGSPTVIATSTLPYGVSKVKTQEQTGYDVTVSRNYYVDDKLQSSEVISQDHFNAVKAVILKGKNIEK